MTLQQVKAKLKGIPKDKQPAVVCALIGHSRIHTSCFGYKYCGRCGTQVGDSLGGYYDGSKNVVVGHSKEPCTKCKANYARMTWRDKFMVRDPFNLKLWE